ncbi:hypothetical protein EAI_17514 [Harpegnathos saltator]|uniref:Uncharacterized protein n=1 Tax=Harpegnathos saltator TaxID=610380 RepID=E2BEW6_HARSA|nr:hypothetical protein EAI_17514 [Harpegnathos saltator]
MTGLIWLTSLLKKWSVLCYIRRWVIFRLTIQQTSSFQHQNLRKQEEGAETRGGKDGGGGGAGGGGGGGEGKEGGRGGERGKNRDAPDWHEGATGGRYQALKRADLQSCKGKDNNYACPITLFPRTDLNFDSACEQSAQGRQEESVRACKQGHRARSVIGHATLNICNIHELSLHDRDLLRSNGTLASSVRTLESPST